jgi:hypothetical protein
MSIHSAANGTHQHTNSKHTRTHSLYNTLSAGMSLVSMRAIAGLLAAYPVFPPLMYSVTTQVVWEGSFPEDQEENSLLFVPL